MATNPSEVTSQQHSFLQIALRGMAMGIAEIIPGVSGGTIAFITGIYERLLNAISSGLPALKNFRKTGVKVFWQSIDGNFLLSLVVGMFVGIGVGAFVITYLLENHAEALWAFFFGLILASVIYVIRSIEKFNTITWISFAIGAIVAYALTAMYPMIGSTNLFYIFCAGMIAICALILPGVSGSFMLLIMGMYTIILGSFKNLLSNPNGQDFLRLVVFGLGCLIGLLGFSRLVSRLFKKFPSKTLAVLAGFMIGSIHKIWPWRNPSLFYDKEHGSMLKAEQVGDLNEALQSDGLKVVLETNVLPENYFSDPNLILVIGSGIFGFLLVFILTRSSK